MSGAQKIQVRVCAITPLNALVTRFCLEKYDGGVLPTFSGGAHTVVKMNDDGRRRLNAYSLMSDPFDTRVWCISVHRDDEGRGGSLYMHRAVQVGDELTVSAPVNLFALDLRAKKHLLIAGGIGITPFLAQIRQLEYLQGHWELHYACRSHALASYADDLLARYPSKVRCHYNDQSQAIDFTALLTGQPLGTHLYVCGPKGMIDLVRRQAEPSRFIWRPHNANLRLGKMKASLKRWNARASILPICVGAGPAANAKQMFSTTMGNSYTMTTGWSAKI